MRRCLCEVCGAPTGRARVTRDRSVSPLSVELGEGCELAEGCVVAPGSVIPAGRSLPAGTVLGPGSLLR